MDGEIKKSTCQTSSNGDMEIIMCEWENWEKTDELYHLVWLTTSKKFVLLQSRRPKSVCFTMLYQQFVFVRIHVCCNGLIPPQNVSQVPRPLMFSAPKL
jgi:hypothetical protein